MGSSNRSNCHVAPVWPILFEVGFARVVQFTRDRAEHSWLKGGSSSVAERQLPKLNVAGSIPVSRSIKSQAVARRSRPCSSHQRSGERNLSTVDWGQHGCPILQSFNFTCIDLDKKSSRHTSPLSYSGTSGFITKCPRGCEALVELCILSLRDPLTGASSTSSRLKSLWG